METFAFLCTLESLANLESQYFIIKQHVRWSMRHCYWINWNGFVIEKTNHIFFNKRILTYDGCFWFHELRMLRRAHYVRKRKLLRDSHLHSHETQSVHKLGSETGWAHSLLSLAFATRWNQKHPSYVNIRLSLKFHLAALLPTADYMRCLKLLTSWVMFWL